MLIYRRIYGGKLEREQDLGKEALLGPLEPAARGSFGSAIERSILQWIDHTGKFQSVLKVLVDDGLSRGGDNAKERGVGAQFP
jgi:hypothetical protein